MCVCVFAFASNTLFFSYCDRKMDKGMGETTAEEAARLKDHHKMLCELTWRRTLFFFFFFFWQYTLDALIIHQITGLSFGTPV